MGIDIQRRQLDPDLILFQQPAHDRKCGVIHALIGWNMCPMVKDDITGKAAQEGFHGNESFHIHEETDGPAQRRNSFRKETDLFKSGGAPPLAILKRMPRTPCSCMEASSRSDTVWSRTTTARVLSFPSFARASSVQRLSVP